MPFIPWPKEERLQSKSENKNNDYQQKEELCFFYGQDRIRIVVLAELRDYLFWLPDSLPKVRNLLNALQLHKFAFIHKTLYNFDIARIASPELEGALQVASKTNNDN